MNAINDLSLKLSRPLHRLNDLDAGLAIAEQLVDEAVWSGDKCAFVGAIAPDALDQPEQYASTGGDAYEGTAGIARFLLLASKFSDNDALYQTAKASLRHALTNVDGCSLFSGAMGIGLVAMEFNTQEFNDIGFALVEQAAADALADDVPADLIAGSAGVLFGLCTLLRARGNLPYKDSPIKDWAIAIGERLISTAKRRTESDIEELSWPVYAGCDDHLCGLAHGASGVALALQALAQHDLQKSSRWRAAAAGARNYERAWYGAQHGSWADLRSDVSDKPSENLVYPHLWCHGSIGVAAERLFADPDDALARADKIAAFEGVLSCAQSLLGGPRGAGAGDEINGSQCHGLASFSDLLIDAWKVSNDAVSLAVARNITSLIREDSQRQQGIRCGIIGGHGTPGLMLGRAGIGWALIRAAKPKLVPSCWRIGELLIA